MPTFIGRVQDLDFIEKVGHCQVILQTESDQLVAITTDPLVLTLLGAAFVKDVPVQADYVGWDRPFLLTRVKVNRDPPPQS